MFIPFLALSTLMVSYPLSSTPYNYVFLQNYTNHLSSAELDLSYFDLSADYGSVLLSYEDSDTHQLTTLMSFSFSYESTENMFYCYAENFVSINYYGVMTFFDTGASSNPYLPTMELSLYNVGTYIYEISGNDYDTSSVLDLSLILSLNFLDETQYRTFLDDAYQSGFENGKDSGYQDGYIDGMTDSGNSSYTDGFNAGKQVGFQEGAQSGTTFWSLFGAVADTPVMMIRRLFNFDLFGTSMVVVALSLLSFLILFKVIKKVIK